MEYCSNCGHEIPGDNFCGNCGKKTKRKLPMKDYSEGREKGLSKVEVDKLGNAILMADSKKKSKKKKVEKKKKIEKEDVTATVAVLVIIFSLIVACSSVIINYVNYLRIENFTTIVSFLIFIFSIAIMIVKKYERKDIFLISLLSVASFLAFVLIVNETIYESSAEEIIDKNKIYLIRVCPLIVSLNFIDVKGIKNQTITTSTIKVINIALMLILITVPFLLLSYSSEANEDFLYRVSIMSFLELGSIVNTLIISLVGTLYIVSIGQRTKKKKNYVFTYLPTIILIVCGVMSWMTATDIEVGQIESGFSKNSPVFLLSCFALMPFIITLLSFGFFEESNE